MDEVILTVIFFIYTFALIGGVTLFGRNFFAVQIGKRDSETGPRPGKGVGRLLNDDDGQPYGGRRTRAHRAIVIAENDRPGTRFLGSLGTVLVRYLTHTRINIGRLISEYGARTIAFTDRDTDSKNS